MKNNLPVTDRENDYVSRMRILSTTDLKGSTRGAKLIQAVSLKHKNIYHDPRINVGAALGRDCYLFALKAPIIGKLHKR